MSTLGSGKRSGTRAPLSRAAPPACVGGNRGIGAPGPHRVPLGRDADAHLARTRHQIRVNAKTIQRVFCDLGLPVLRKTPKRKPKQLKLFEKEAPGDSIQVEVKVVQVKREKVFQYTARDDCTRLRVVRLDNRQNRPQQNGKVERSHRVDGEEFWSRHDFPTVAAAESSLAVWERQYNHERFSMALHGRTPMEKLRAVLPGAALPDNQLDVQ